MRSILQFVILIMLAPMCLNAQWTKVTSLTVSSLNDMYIDGSGTFFVSSSNGGFHRSTDGTASWQAINNSLSGDGLRTENITKIGNVLWGSTVNGPYKSTNNGDTWERKINGMIISGGSNNYFINAIAEVNGALYTSTYGAMYRSTDGGESWNPTSVAIQGAAITGYTIVNGELFAGRDNINNPIMYKSTDNGFNWTNVNIWNNFPVGVLCMYTEPGKFFAGTGHGMWLSTNGGINWVMRNEGLSLDPYVSSIVRVGGTMIASLTFGGSGMFKTTNEGLNWTDIGDSLPFMVSISKALVHNNNIYIAGSNGVWKRPLDQVTAVEPQTGTVNSYKLEQNYPNPFNPVTIINYQLSMSNNVKLSVYDVSGKLVKILLNEKQNPGRYNVTFDGNNLTSGVYYYELRTDGFSEFKKMILIK